VAVDSEAEIGAPEAGHPPRRQAPGRGSLDGVR